ncbi:MAG TPA: ferrous iron transport protein B [Bellilinea sp.]|nr:ferrous iron transport protein B [Bellilinea sp.]
MVETFTIALAGNPNCGKSTIFNALTGSRQHVGNWPGKTVEKKSGKFQSKDLDVEIVDLPGTYSLSPYSQEEVIARNFIISEHPKAIVSVIDSANLERNLYLTSQLTELGCPVVLALNMMDLAQSRGIEIDLKKLSEKLGRPVIPLVACEGQGLAELIEGIRTTVALQPAPGISSDPLRIDLGAQVEAQLEKLTGLIAADAKISKLYPARWLAYKLLEEDQDVVNHVAAARGGKALLAAAQQSLEILQPVIGDGDFEMLVADQRYARINELVKSVSTRASVQKLTVSDKIDKIVTNRWLGVPIFLALMWVVFKLTTDVAGPYVDWIDGVINGPIAAWLSAFLGAVGLGGTWVESLMQGGIVAGVGGVLVFVPVLMAMYLALALLEDSGYMARAAFVMDRIMHALGLHGKSFLPMIVGFGCTVPAFSATRTLENEKDRILTGLLVPFMSCGARLPVYVLFAAIFFPEHAGWVIFGMYVLGIVLAILVGFVLRRTVFKNNVQSPFVMELPPYHLPKFKNIWFHMWERTSAFVRKAWTIIMATSVAVWLLMAIPTGGGAFAAVDTAQSAFAGVSNTFAPVFAPAGFGSWEASGSLVTGFVAKEVVVSSLSQAYGIEEAAEEAEPTTFLQDLGDIAVTFAQSTWDAIKAIPGIVGISFGAAEEESVDSGLMASIRAGFDASSGGHGALASVAYMAFVLLYTPCMVAVAAERKEFGSKVMWASVIGQLALAYLVSVIIFQGGLLLGF